MNFENFKRNLYTAYKKEEVSKKFIEGLNKLCEEQGLDNNFVAFEFEKQEQPNLVFHGPSDKNLKALEKKQPKISVIIPSYNRSAFLCRCIDSILEQNYDNLEIIIINDCSTDDTAEVVKERYGKNKKIVYVENETNLGPGGNRQKAYNVATGEYVVFADDDDFYLEPDFYKKAIALFLDYGNLAMVCANSVIFDDIKKEFNFLPLTFCGVMEKQQFLFGFGNKYKKPNSTFPTVYKKSILDQADFENMKMMNDTSIYMRAACFGDVCMMKDWVGVYWVHESNISKKLPYNFILENLEEKNNIYQLICKQFNTENPNWLVSQQMITINYYLNSRRLSLFKFLKLKKWIKLNCTDVAKELIKETTKAYKSSIKRR